jgi:pyoverdine/dityrosine biosynthesis protein Dit1
MRILRIERDKKLQESDWRTNNDYPYADADAWATYRAALRNLPAEIAAGNVTAPVIENNILIFDDWPAQP